MIANATRFLRDSLYEAICKHPDLEVVGDVSEESAIVPATDRTDPDCLIVALDDRRVPEPIRAGMLERRPHMKIVAIGEATNVVAIYWKSPQGDLRCTYTTSSREDILRAIHYPVS